MHALDPYTFVCSAFAFAFGYVGCYVLLDFTLVTVYGLRSTVCYVTDYVTHVCDVPRLLRTTTGCLPHGCCGYRLRLRLRLHAHVLFYYTAFGYVPARFIAATFVCWLIYHGLPARLRWLHVTHTDFTFTHTRYTFTTHVHTVVTPFGLRYGYHFTRLVDFVGFTPTVDSRSVYPRFFGSGYAQFTFDSRWLRLLRLLPLRSRLRLVTTRLRLPPVPTRLRCWMPVVSLLRCVRLHVYLRSHFTHVYRTRTLRLLPVTFYVCVRLLRLHVWLHTYTFDFAFTYGLRLHSHHGSVVRFTLVGLRVVRLFGYRLRYGCWL